VLYAGLNRRTDVQDEITFEVETEIATEVNQRRYRWRLKGREEDRPSPESFATRREAVQAGQIALERALERGRIGR
jgi:hypothetical protein